jgi:hypothetical protein
MRAPRGPEKVSAAHLQDVAAEQAVDAVEVDDERDALAILVEIALATALRISPTGLRTQMAS